MLLKILALSILITLIISILYSTYLVSNVNFIVTKSVDNPFLYREWLILIFRRSGNIIISNAFTLNIYYPSQFKICIGDLTLFNYFNQFDVQIYKESTLITSLSLENICNYTILLNPGLHTFDIVITYRRISGIGFLITTFSIIVKHVKSIT